MAPTAKKATAAKKLVNKTKELHAGDSTNAYIPDKSLADKYVGRMIHGVWDIDLLRNARANRRNVLLMGETGSGKTLLGEAFAAKEHVIYYSVPCDVSIDPSSLFGKMIPTDTPGKFVWQDGPVTQVVREGGVLNISEINFMPPKIAASLYPLLDQRRYIPLLQAGGEVVRAHDDLLVIADMNPEYRGTMELNAAFKNRFAFKINWGYNTEVETSLVKSRNLRSIAAQLRESYGTEVMTPVSTNMLMELETFAADTTLGLTFAIANFVSAFDSDDRVAVEKTFDLNRAGLERDYAPKKKSSKAGNSPESDLEEIEFDFEMDDAR